MEQKKQKIPQLRSEIKLFLCLLHLLLCSLTCVGVRLWVPGVPWVQVKLSAYVAFPSSRRGFLAMWMQEASALIGTHPSLQLLLWFSPFQNSFLHCRQNGRERGRDAVRERDEEKRGGITERGSNSLWGRADGEKDSEERQEECMKMKKMKWKFVRRKERRNY